MRWITAVSLAFTLLRKAHDFKHETSTSNLIDMISDELWSLLPQGEGHDCMDAGGRATQEAKAEDEGVYKTKTYALLIPSPQPSPCGRGG
jgi:hypothetical protein